MQKSERTRSKTGRLRPLDGLRGLAALGVVGYHYLYIAPMDHHALGDPVALARYGNQGVQLFFVISGFVITMSLRRGTLRDFIASRLGRLFPTYWAAILTTALVLLILPLPGHGLSAGQVVVNLTMLQSYFGVAHVDGAYWTLAIELAFYVQAAALWGIGLLKGHRLIPTLYVWVVIAAGISLAVAGGPQEPGTPLVARDILQVFTYIPWFICGIVALLIVEGRRDWSVYGVGVVAGLAMVLLDHQKNVGLFGVLYLIIILVVLLWRPLGTDSRVLLFLGEISYALYLVHQIIGQTILLFFHEIGLNRAVAVLITIAIALLLATGITYWIDRPLRGRVRRLIAGTRKPDPSPVASSGM